MKPIESWQRSKIYGIGNALGIVDKSGEDELHILIFRITGLGSMKLLDVKQANDVILELQRLQSVSNTPPKAKPKPKTPTAVSGMMSAGQQKKAWALMYELQKLDIEPSSTAIGDRICGIIKKEMKTDCLPKKPFVWLDSTQGNKLIEILKKYIASAKRKAGVADGLDR